MEVAVTASVPVCPNCHRQVPYRQVSTNANGNQGRLLAKCNQWIHPVTNIRCNFFCWHPNSRHNVESLSFQSSPTIASSSQTLNPAVNFFSEQLASSQDFQLPTTQSQVVTFKCLTSGCNLARIRKGCTHQRCKHHCKEQGGCLSHGNTQPEPISSTFPSIFADTLTLPPSSVADPALWNPIPLVETQPHTTPIATRTRTGGQLPR